VVGALAFHLYRPQRPATYLLFALSMLVATVVSFGCRYVVNALAYWLLDGRGPQLAWVLASNVLSGLYFPLAFLPDPVAGALWVATPFPWLLQAPVDVLVERHSTLGQVGLVAGGAGWALLTLAAARYVQRRGERKMVIQGG
jgi:ABC-2 type transport system permease protein